MKNYTKIINKKVRMVQVYDDGCYKLHIGNKYIHMDKNHNITYNVKDINRYKEEVDYLLTCKLQQYMVIYKHREVDKNVYQRRL